MKTVSQLLKDLGGVKSVSDYSGIKKTTLCQMAKRNSIHVAYWPMFVGMCKRKRITGVNYTTLVNHHAGIE
jgi:hypothetical protein